MKYIADNVTILIGWNRTLNKANPMDIVGVRMTSWIIYHGAFVPMRPTHHVVYKREWQTFEKNRPKIYPSAFGKIFVPV